MSCEICGQDAPETTECPECGRMRCMECDMGVGTVCVDCDG